MRKAPVKFATLTPTAKLPRQQTKRAAGLDLTFDGQEPVVLRAGERRLFSTGVRMEIPTGFEGQIRPRSGLALEHGITVLNSPGTIDADYRGEIKVLLINLGEDPVRISPGDRIAQIVIAPCWQPVQNLVLIERESGGFGSTGE